jgi:hypothetical protein
MLLTMFGIPMRKFMLMGRVLGREQDNPHPKQANQPGLS